MTDCGGLTAACFHEFTCLRANIPKYIQKAQRMERRGAGCVEGICNQQVKF